VAWPLLAYGGRFVKKSTRRDVLERMKAERAAARGGVMTAAGGAAAAS
jgi:hypothetical protein